MVCTSQLPKFDWRPLFKPNALWLAIILNSFKKIFLWVFTNPFTQPGCDTRSILYAKFNRFEFRLFLLLVWLPDQGQSTQSALLFTHCWRENNWIHTFPKGISAMWNESAPSGIFFCELTMIFAVNQFQTM